MRRRASILFTTWITRKLERRRVQAFCEAVLKAKPGDRDARYFLGAAHTALAAFAKTIDHDKREAFRHGKKAYEYHLGIVMEQLTYYDAYLTLGRIFHAWTV